MELSPSIIPSKVLRYTSGAEAVRFGTGTAVSSETKQIIKNVHTYLVNKGVKDAVEETMLATGVFKGTISRILANDSSPPKSKRNKISKFGKIDDFTKDLIKNKVYNGFRIKMMYTLDMLVNDLKLALEHDGGYPYGKSTKGKLLKQMGFTFKKVNKKIGKMDSPIIAAW